MLRTTLKSLLSHKLRLVSTGIAVVLGVAFMAGTVLLLELGARWNTQWDASVVRQSGIFCYRGLVRGLFGEEAA